MQTACVSLGRGLTHLVRREVITLLCGAAAMPATLWPLAMRAQQPSGMRRVGVLMGFSETDLTAKGWLLEFWQGLREFGLIEGRNLHVEIRWAAAGLQQFGVMAREIIERQPDLILTVTTPATLAVSLLKNELRKIWWG